MLVGQLFSVDLQDATFGVDVRKIDRVQFANSVILTSLVLTERWEVNFQLHKNWQI